MEGSNKSILIVGAGTIGLFLAHELMKRGERIILVEAGADNFSSYNSTEYIVSGLPHNGVSLGRVKGVGGTSNLWGGQLTEFIRKDVDEKGSFDQPEWPINWQEVQRYYLPVYEKLGLQGDCKKAESLGIADHKDELQISFTRWLKQPNFRNHFAGELERSPLVEFIKKAVVTNLHFKNDTCVSIEVSQDGHKRNISNFGKVVLASGTIEICRTLLIAARSADCPFHQNKWIGKFFQDHINIRVGQVSNPSKKFFARFSNFFVNGEKLQPKLRLNYDRTTDEYLGISGIFSFDSSVSKHIDNFKQFSKALLSRSHQKTGVLQMLKMIPGMFAALPQISMIIYHYLKNNRVYVPFSSGVSLNLQTQQISIAESKVALSDEKDIAGRPKAVIEWKVDGREFEAIRKFCYVVKDFLSAYNLGKLQFEKWFEQECNNNDGSWIKHISDVYHQAGGTIMSNSAETGVVDKYLKVHNTSNVFVCGAAVMPTSGYANTTLTALALTMRFADHVSSLQTTDQQVVSSNSVL